MPVATIHPLSARGSPEGPRSSCSRCGLSDLCLIQGLDERELRAFDSLLTGKRRVRKDHVLFHQGEALRFLYVVHFGCVKTSQCLGDGRERVTGFHFPGDLLGLDAMAACAHTTTATALEDAEVCAIPYDALLALESESKGKLRRRIHEKFGAEMQRERRLLSIMANTLSEPRVAAFLLMIAQRMSERGYSATEFNLRMSRAEMGSYLGLTLETVSRALGALSHRGWIDVRNRNVRINDAASLQRLCEPLLPASADTSVPPLRAASA